MDAKGFTAGRVGKVLMHQLFWRYQNGGSLVDPTMHVSHLDADKRYIDAVLEPVELNESRKYCHLFGWYAPLAGEESPRCPHRGMPACRGPLDARHAVALE